MSVKGVPKVSMEMGVLLGTQTSSELRAATTWGSIEFNAPSVTTGESLMRGHRSGPGFQ